MNTQETNEIRELTATELDDVAGGLLAEVVNAIASVVNGAAEQASRGGGSRPYGGPIEGVGT